MSVRLKFVLLIVGCLAVVVTAVSWGGRRLLLERFARLEEQDARQNAERALAALSDELAYLADQAEDYAYWDKLYAFMESRDPAFLRSEIPSAVQSTIRVQIVALLDTEGRLVFGRSLDFEHRKNNELPESLGEHLVSPRMRARKDGTPGIEGIVVLPEGPLLLASRPILTSEDAGPARGTLILGRYLDEWEIEKLTRYTRFALGVARFDDPGPDEDLRWARSALSARYRILARPRDADRVAGYALIEDLYERPALILRADAYRRIYHEGQASADYLAAAVALTALAAALVALVLLETLPAAAPATSEKSASGRP